MRLELTAFRLWDWRAAYCATEAWYILQYSLTKLYYTLPKHLKKKKKKLIRKWCFLNWGPVRVEDEVGVQLDDCGREAVLLPLLTSGEGYQRELVVRHLFWTPTCCFYFDTLTIILGDIFIWNKRNKIPYIKPKAWKYNCQDFCLSLSRL